MLPPDLIPVFRVGLVPVVGALLALPGTALHRLHADQERPVVSSAVTVSGSQATLEIEFADGAGTRISLRDGAIWIDGEEAGAYSVGGPLEASWRALLADVIPLDDGPLASALAAWEPGDLPEGQAASAGARLDRALEAALAVSPGVSGAPSGLQSALSGQTAEVGADVNIGQLRLLLERGGELASALDETLPERLILHVGEDVTIAEDADVDGALVVVDGNATVLGQVSGDVVVAGGLLRIGEDARIRGAVRLVDAELRRTGGTVEGAVHTISEQRESDEAGGEANFEEGRPAAGAAFEPLRHIRSGISGLFGDVFELGIILLLGFLVVHFFGDRLQNISDAVRAAPGRAALVGAAGGFLLLPVWILGILVLVVSVVGIPVLVAWLPLFPLAAILGHGIGYLAVAAAVGEWLAWKRIPALDRIRASNQLHVLALGAVALAIPSALSHVAEMGGSSLGGFFHWLFGFLAGVTVAAAAMVGFGGVLLTGAGRTSDVDEMAARYGGAYRAGRAWTRRRRGAASSGGAAPGKRRRHDAEPGSRGRNADAREGDANGR